MAILYRRPDVAHGSESLEEPLSVLFFQDDPAVAEMYQLKLSLDGYRVTLADAGEDLEPLLAKQAPDIVYVDIRSTTAKNIDLLRALRRANRERRMPVIVLSGASPEELRSKGVPLASTDYVVRCDSVRTTLEPATASR